MDTLVSAYGRRPIVESKLTADVARDRLLPMSDVSWVCLPEPFVAGCVLDLIWPFGHGHERTI